LAVTGKKKIFDGRYDIISIVGRGSRSVVYHSANINDSNNSVALKVLVENKKDKNPLAEKLRREALALVSCHHPYVIRLDDFHSVGDICYLAMEYAYEGDLRKYLNKNNWKLSNEILLNFFKQCAEGLDYIHRTGIVHRDIKPDNLLVVSDSEIRIGDFGVAFLPGDSDSTSELKNAVGTFDYMAPEVLEGTEYTTKSDIYSLGISFYEALTGSNPFEKVSISEQLNTRKNLPLANLINNSIPEQLASIIAKACAYLPSDRYTSAKELLAALKNISKKETSNNNSYSDSVKSVSNETSTRPQLTVITGNAGQINISEETSEPESLEPQISDKDNSSDMNSTAREIYEKNNSDFVASSYNLKDSKSSRTQTVFIGKESVQKLRDQISESNPSYKPNFSNLLDKLSLVSDTFKNLSNAALFGIGIVTLLTIYFIFAGSSKNPNSYQIESAEISNQADSIKDLPVSIINQNSNSNIQSAIIPTYSGEELNFPNLPSGIYTGAVTGITGSIAVPLTVMSIADKNKAIFMLALDGINPAVVSLAGKNVGDSIKLVANGIILEISGSIKNNEVVGTVKNLTSGASGVFKLKPAS
jgi:serine/threonine protein kinase